MSSLRRYCANEQPCKAKWAEKEIQVAYRRAQIADITTIRTHGARTYQSIFRGSFDTINKEVIYNRLLIQNAFYLNQTIDSENPYLNPIENKIAQE